jgi:nicotinamidase-related amidase
MAEDEQTGAALVLIDVLDDLRSDYSQDELEGARLAAPKILALRERAHEAGVPVIYANRPFDREELTAFSHARDAGHVVTRMLVPTDKDHLVLTSGPSAFDASELQSLPQKLEARTVVLAGFTADNDVLKTATDARAKGYHVVVPSDCTAAGTNELTEVALGRIQSAANARVDDSLAIDLRALRYEHVE